MRREPRHRKARQPAAATPEELPAMEPEELCDIYGAVLFDYCRTSLPPAEAERAARGALVSGHHHADRLHEPQHQRAWLYALARAHRTRRRTNSSAGTGGPDGWTRPGSTCDPLLLTTLATLEEAHQEVLDLALRHGLTAVEIALIFDAGAVEVENLIRAASDHLERLVAAMDAARTSDGCPAPVQLAAAPAPPGSAPLARHVSACARCLAAPRTATAAGLLAQVPIAAASATLATRLTSAQPLPAEGGWRPDGFPEQTPTLTPALAAIRSTRPPTAPGGAAPSPPSTGRAGEFRAWEQRNRNASDHEEFWEPRHDEANPEARLSLRPLWPVLRVGGLIAATVTAILTAGAVWSELQPRPHASDMAPAAAPATTLPATLSATTLPPDLLLLDEPPAGQPTLQPSTTAPTTTTTRAPATTRPSSRPATPAAPAPTPTRTAAPANAGSGDRPTGNRERPRTGHRPDRPTATRRPASAAAAQTLPKPLPPTASLSPSSLSLGSGRSGSFALLCSTGTCSITSASGTNGIAVSATRISVSAPASRPGCTTVTESGTATIVWSGTTTGDGRTTDGTTTASGTLTLTISWTVKADKGDWIPTGSVTHGGDRQGHWSNCRNG